MRVRTASAVSRQGDDALINNAIVFILIFIHPILHHLVSPVPSSPSVNRE